MADQNMSMIDLLNLSISPPGQGAVVNFRALYTLLHGILRHLDIRDITVCWSPEESSPERSREEAQPATGGPEGRDTAETGPDTAHVPTQGRDGDERQVLELIHKIQKESEQLQDNVKGLRRQQDKAAGDQSEWIKTVEALNQRVEALEQSETVPEDDERFVTWEAIYSALNTGRENLKEGLVLTNDSNKQMKDKDITKTAQDTSDDSVTGAGIPTEASQAPGPGPVLVPPLKNLSLKFCGSTLYQETMKALRDIGRLKQRCDELEERLTALDLKRSREHEELLQLRQMLHDRGSEDKFDEVHEKLEDQFALVRSLLCDRDKSAQLVSGVQKTILHLQREYEKLHETTRYLHEDNQQNQTHIEELYKTTGELEEKKADKNMVETEIRADKSVLDSKVSRLQFDSVTEQLSNMFNELLTKITDQEQDWGKVMEKLSSEMDCKLNRIELDSVKKQLETRWKSIQERMKSEGALQQDDAAAIRKQLVEQFHCLSCDRPVLKHTPGPQVMTLPTSPGLQPHRSMRPFSVYTLDQIRQYYRSECLLEVADYSLYSVPRSCGGSHTVTPFTQRHRSTQPHTGQNRLMVQADHAREQSEEVDIVGLDGHIYKGRLNAPPSRNAKSKLPTIATRDGSSRNRGRPRSSACPRESAPSPGRRHPSPPSGSCSPGRDWPVSALGCTSRSSMVPMSVKAAGGAP